MIRHQIRDGKECLCPMVEYLNKITSKLVDSFHTESNKMGYLRNAVLDKKWETTPLKNISAEQYNLTNL